MSDKPELIPTMRLRWGLRRVRVPTEFVGGGTVTKDMRVLQQWFEAPDDATAVGPAPGEWRDVPAEVES